MTLASVIVAWQEEQLEI